MYHSYKGFNIKDWCQIKSHFFIPCQIKLKMNINLMTYIIYIKKFNINNCGAKLNSTIEMKSKTQVILSLLFT